MSERHVQKGRNSNPSGVDPRQRPFSASGSFVLYNYVVVYDSKVLEREQGADVAAAARNDRLLLLYRNNPKRTKQTGDSNKRGSVFCVLEQQQQELCLWIILVWNRIWYIGKVSHHVKRTKASE